MTDRETPSAIGRNDDLPDIIRRARAIDEGRRRGDSFGPFPANEALDLASALVRLAEREKRSSERASADEGYPGIAHDLETMRTTLERARRHIALNGAFRSNDDMMREIDLVLSAPRPSIAPLADLDFERADKLALDALTYESGSLTGEERKALARAYRALRSLPPTTAPTAEIVRQLREHADQSGEYPTSYDAALMRRAADALEARYTRYPTTEASMGDPFNCPDCGAHDYGLFAASMVGCPHCLRRQRDAAQEWLWKLYEGIYGHRKAEGIDPFKTAVGGALELAKAWRERGEPAERAMRSTGGDTALTQWLRDHAPDCGDNSCLFGGKGKGGMRTNGGCRCYKDVRPDMRRIYIERLQALFSAIEDTTK